MTLETIRSNLPANPPATTKPTSRFSDATVTLWAVCISGALFQFDLTALVATLADVGADLGMAAASSAWVIDIYSLALVFSLPACGTLADRFGRRRLFALGAALFAVASILCAVAPSFAILLLCRALQGISGACFTTASLALLAAAYQGPGRARAFGFVGTVIGAAMVAGPPLGALIASTIGWRWIFWLNLPLCAVVLALTFARVAESFDPDAVGRTIDGLGCALLAIAIGCLAFVLLDGRSLGWLSPAVAVLLAISLVCVLAFVRVERRHAYPAIDLSLMGAPKFLSMCITAVASSVGYWSLLMCRSSPGRGWGCGRSRRAGSSPC